MTFNEEEYFNWLVRFIIFDQDVEMVMYDKLLFKLYNTEFTYILPLDENRAFDGLKMRDKFVYETCDNSLNYILEDKPCSILEMMIALSNRCEIHIMSDPDYGDRTGRWFWDMIYSLGLLDMTNDKYDENYINTVLTRFLNREFEPNGRGSLAIVNNGLDMRQIEIWYQLNLYLSQIINES